MKRQLPIKTVSELATLLQISKHDLWKTANTANKTYSRWSEPKPSGGTRNFSAPYPSLRALQRKLHKLLLSRIDFGTSSNYGIKQRSNITNAGEHLGNQVIFTFDLKSFFPSVRPERVFQALKDELSCSDEVASILTKLVTCDYQLPQGAPTSTDIANIVTFRLQRRLIGLAKQWGLTFTIYADDVTFSGKTIPESVENAVKMIVRNEGFRIHSSKGGVFGKSSSQIITGINIAHGPSVGKVKKIWRSQLHNAKVRLRYGEHDETQLQSAERRYNSRMAYASSVKRLAVKPKSS